jgi:hypothetical protein
MFQLLISVANNISEVRITASFNVMTHFTGITRKLVPEACSILYTGGASVWNDTGICAIN